MFTREREKKEESFQEEEEEEAAPGSLRFGSHLPLYLPIFIFYFILFYFFCCFSSLILSFVVVLLFPSSPSTTSFLSNQPRALDLPIEQPAQVPTTSAAAA